MLQKLSEKESFLFLKKRRPTAIIESQEGKVIIGLANELSLLEQLWMNDSSNIQNCLKDHWWIIITVSTLVWEIVIERFSLYNMLDDLWIKGPNSRNMEPAWRCVFTKFLLAWACSDVPACSRTCERTILQIFKLTQRFCNK